MMRDLGKPAGPYSWATHSMVRRRGARSAWSAVSDLGRYTPGANTLRDHELGAGPGVTAGWARNAYAVLPSGRPVFSGHNISAFTQAGLKPFPERDQ